MDFLKRFIPILLLPLLVCSCYTDFNPDIYSKQVLCMNSLITAGEPVALQLTHTWRFSDGKPEDINVTDATVEIYINGELKGVMTYDPDHKNWNDIACPMYVSDCVPEPGDEIYIRAYQETYGEATASVTVPQPVTITDFKPNLVPGEPQPSYNGCFCSVSLDPRITFRDPAEPNNYYAFEIEIQNPQSIDTGETGVDFAGNEYHKYYSGGLEIQGIVYDVEPIFSEHLTIMEQIFDVDYYGYSIFTDKQINGQEYTLRTEFNYPFYRIFNPEKIESLYHTKLIAKLSAITEDYYDYQISQWQAGDGLNGTLAGNGFADPIFVHSNVSTGAGIVAARAVSTAEYDLAPWTSQLPYQGVNH